LTFSGAISDSARASTLATNTGATITFTGAITASTGANPAFNATARHGKRHQQQ